MGVLALGQRALGLLDPETAHRATIAWLRTGLVPALASPSRGTTVAGVRFPNLVGVAAGFDKDGEALVGLARLGFGHVEVGTVTPRPQPGNPKPRVFRLPEDRAVINRYGFNGAGHDVVHERLWRARERGFEAVLGVNVGANKDSEDRAADYAAGVSRFSDVADYLTVNVSSPNTPGLRGLQEGDALRRLLGLAREAGAAAKRERPIFLKIAPDLDDSALDELVGTARESGIAGLIVSNTTIGREGLRSAHKGETGGLSGAPLMPLATRTLAKVRERAGPSLALVGVGGVSSASDAQAKLDAGAELVQLYTGLVYGGVALARDLLRADLHLRQGR